MKKLIFFVLFQIFSQFLCYGLSEESKWDQADRNAHMYYFNQNLNQAEIEVHKAIDLAQKEFGENQDHYAISLNLLGAIYSLQNKYEEAEKIFNEIIDIYEKDAENIYKAGNAFYNLANIHLIQGKDIKAEADYNSAIVYFNKAKDPGKTWLLHTLYEMLPLCNTPAFKQTKSEDILKQIIVYQEKKLGEKKNSKEKNKVWDIIQVLISIGDLYSQYDLNRADSYYKEAEELIINTHEKSGHLLTVLIQRAALYEKLKDPVKQKEFLRRVVEIIESHISVPVEDKKDKNNFSYQDDYKKMYENLCELKKYYQILGMQEMVKKCDERINQIPEDILDKILKMQEMDKTNKSLKMLNIIFPDRVHGIPIHFCSSCKQPLPYGEKGRLCQNCKAKEIIQKDPDTGSTTDHKELTVDEVIKLLQSKNYIKIRTCAKSIYNDPEFYEDEVLLAEVAKVLEWYLTDKTETSVSIDAISWCCKVLGLSNNPKYRSVLETLLNSDVHKKIKGHIKKSLANLN